jgi:hypothetical protein
MMDSGELARLTAELKERFRAWADRPEPWSDAVLSGYARRAFALQYEGVRPYRLYCQRLGVSPAEVSEWRDVPPVPTAAFREVDLAVETTRSAPSAGEPLVFRTSGTTGGPAHRGSHRIIDPSLYHASMTAAFLRHFLEGPDRLPVCSLVPRFADSDGSSLSWMCDAVIVEFGSESSVWAAESDHIDWGRADAFAEHASISSSPVCVLATTLALNAWLRRLEARGERLKLPDGSRIMDTGGIKAQAGLYRSDSVRRAVEWLGIPEDRVINEFGMTELLSQRYSRPVPSRQVSSHPAPFLPEDSGALLLHAPPWLRTRALNPVTLVEVPDGEPGVLCHLDLANVGSVCAVLTEDTGKVTDNVVEWIGRSPGATPRGCSLATARLLEAQANV